MKKTVDELLKDALKPADEPDFWLNQKILNQAKETKQMKKRNIRKITAAAACAVMVLAVGSATAVAAWKYLAPKQVAEHFEDQKLAKAFEQEGIFVNETQSVGGYDITLLGIVSGEFISEHLSTANGEVLSDRSYVVTAIANADGTPMPEISEEAYNEASFFVSPMISGYDPMQYNAYTLQGGYSETVQDGISYRMMECSNIEIFADHTLYLGVTDGFAPNSEAFVFDEASGKISKNENYDGINALFVLPVDVKKADPEAAEEMIRSIEKPEDTETAETDIDALVNRITPENIDEYAVRVEETVQQMTVDEEGRYYGTWECGGMGGESSISKEEFFPDGKPGMSSFIGFHGTDEPEKMCITTFTLNEDGSITLAVYQLKNNE